MTIINAGTLRRASVAIAASTLSLFCCLAVSAQINITGADGETINLGPNGIDVRSGGNHVKLSPGSINATSSRTRTRVVTTSSKNSKTKVKAKVRNSSKSSSSVSASSSSSSSSVSVAKRGKKGSSSRGSSTNVSVETRDGVSNITTNVDGSQTSLTAVGPVSVESGSSGTTVNGINVDGVNINGRNGITVNGVNGVNGIRLNGRNGITVRGVNGRNSINLGLDRINLNGLNGINLNGLNGVNLNGLNRLNELNGANGISINGANGITINGANGVNGIAGRNTNTQVEVVASGAKLSGDLSLNDNHINAVYHANNHGIAIYGNHCEIQLQGPCREIAIYGNHNKVFAENVGSVAVMGNYNVTQWTKGAAPQVAVLGKDNQVSGPGYP